MLTELESSHERDRELILNIQRLIIFGKKKLPNGELINHACIALSLASGFEPLDKFIVNLSLKIRYHLMDLYTWNHFDDFEKARITFKEFEEEYKNPEFSCLVTLSTKEELEKMKNLVEQRYLKYKKENLFFSESWISKATDLKISHCRNHKIIII